MNNNQSISEITAPITKAKNKNILRFFLRKSDVIKLSFARIIITIGNSKMAPKGTINEMTKSTYWPIENSGCNSGVAKPMKNLTAAGNTRKYAKRTPIKNNIMAKGKNQFVTFFSRFVSAGMIKAHASYSQIGEEPKIPATNATFMYVKKASVGRI